MSTTVRLFRVYFFFFIFFFFFNAFALVLLFQTVFFFSFFFFFRCFTIWSLSRVLIKYSIFDSLMVLYPDSSIRMSIFSSVLRFKFSVESFIRVLKDSFKGISLCITSRAMCIPERTTSLPIVFALLKETKYVERVRRESYRFHDHADSAYLYIRVQYRSVGRIRISALKLVIEGEYARYLCSVYAER